MVRKIGMILITRQTRGGEELAEAGVEAAEVKIN